MVLVASFSLSYAQEIAEKTTEIDLVSDRAKESTVRIVGGNFSTGGMGTGFFVDRDKIVTNIHVVAVPGFYTAKLNNSKTVWRIEEVTAFDIENDLVVLKIADEGTPLPLGNSDKVQIGEPVYAVGFPTHYKVTKGTIHGIQKNKKWFRMTVDVSHGNSGGPILNSEGEVIGIATAVLGSYSYAIPSNTVKAILTETKTESIQQWYKRKVIRAYVYHSQGTKKFNDENYADAIRDFNQAIELSPEDAEIYKFRGKAKARLGNIKGAIEDYNQCLILKPDDVETYRIRGERKLEIDDYKGAIEDFSQVIKLIPNSVVAYEKRSWAKEALGDYAGVIEDSTHLLKLIPDDYYAYRTRGSAKRELNDYNGAIEDFTQAIKLRPGHISDYNDRGLTKFLLEDYSGAIEDHNLAIHFSSAIDYYDGVNPEEIDAYIYRGRAKVKIGDPAGAKKDFTHVIKLQPENPTAYIERGHAKVTLKDYQGAIADYSKAIELNPKSADAYHNRGLAKKALGQHDAAKIDFEKAKEIDPNVGE